MRLVSQTNPLDTIFHNFYAEVIYKEDFYLTGQRAFVSYRLDTLKSNKINWVRLVDTLHIDYGKTYTARTYFSVPEVFSITYDVVPNFKSKTPALSGIDILYRNNGIECLRLAFHQEDTTLSLISITKRDSLNYSFLNDYLYLPLNKGSFIGNMNVLRGENSIYKLYFDEITGRVSCIEVVFQNTSIGVKIFLSGSVTITKIERCDYTNNRKKIFLYNKIPLLNSVEEYVLIKNDYIKDGCFYYYNKNSGKIISTVKYKDGKIIK